MTETELRLERKVEVASHYDREVRIYERRRFSGIGGELFSNLEKEHATTWLKKCSVLQIGTATGRFTEFLPSQGFEYCGIEISRNMARHAAKRCAGSEAQVIMGDGENLPFKSSSFENVLSVRSFHFIPAPNSFLKDAFRVLVPGGRLVVSFEVLFRATSLFQRIGLLSNPLPQRTYYFANRVVSLAERNGFNVVWVGKVTKMPLNFYWKLPWPVLKILRRFHKYFPSYLGTVGSVVAEKPL